MRARLEDRGWALTGDDGGGYAEAEYAPAGYDDDRPTNSRRPPMVTTAAVDEGEHSPSEVSGE